jgi:LmbE family N-acetylglucosaminyl deacetylase
MKKILVLAAHPDDETFGLGGTIVKHSKNRDDVFVLTFTEGESARKINEKNIIKRRENAKKACAVLGVKKTKFLDFQDQKLDSIPLLELCKEIESVIKIWKPEIIYTHFWGDLNQDHRRIFEASMIASRPIGKYFPTKILCYEVPSSTEWGINGFKPNIFVDVEEVSSTKIRACKYYKNELRKFPHPRSLKALSIREQYWGSVSNKKHAEAFVLVREVL